MKFVVTYSFEPDREKRDEAIARFQRTGGLPPEGAKLLGRWTRADFSGVEHPSMGREGRKFGRSRSCQL